jgi:hypothetical protein
MAKYIRCNCCGKRVDFGEEIVKFPGYCGVYCSPECFADSYADFRELNEDVASDCCQTVYDDDEDKRKLQEDILRTEAEIEELQKKLKVNKILLTQYE